MGNIIEVTARNELLRRDGRHTAHEFLDKIEDISFPVRRSSARATPWCPRTWRATIPSPPHPRGPCSRLKRKQDNGELGLDPGRESPQGGDE